MESLRTSGMNKRVFKTAGGCALSAIGVAVCVGLLFASHLEKARRELILPDSLCPVENPVKVWSFYKIFPPKVTREIAVVVDATDRIPGKQRDEIVSWFNAESEFVRSLGRFDKVEIYQLDEIVSDRAPVFKKCSPPSKANPWIENPRVVRENFEKKFLSELHDTVKSLAAQKEKNFSPILEMGEKIFDAHDEMILISDLMHHTARYSLYGGVGFRHDYDDYSRTNYADSIKKNRADKTMTTIYIFREKLQQWQNKTLREFWVRHMESDGGEFAIAKTLSSIPFNNSDQQ